MSSLQGLPPLPPSLSALLSSGRDEWRHLPPGLPSVGDEPTYSNLPPARPPPAPPAGRSPPPPYTRAGSGGSRGGSPASSRPRQGPLQPLPRPGRRGSALDPQLERLRREMADLRQLDLALLYQLWSLNDAIQELKQLERSPSWDNGYDGSADEEEQQPRHALSVVAERLSATSSSSLEFGDV